MISVLVTNIKGGCGKTTLATNLATAFATGGLGTALAEADRLKCALGWLGRRGGGRAPIQGLDWRKSAGPVKGGVQRLVIDAPAAVAIGHVGELLRAADLVLVPVLPSVFDEASTARFLAKLRELKPIRRNRKNIALVVNRLRPRSRAAQRLEAFLGELGHPVAARLSERALYAELAVQGLGLFDLPPGAAVQQARAEWLPLLRMVEERGDGPRDR
jgi:chromosome partitioning protein